MCVCGQAGKLFRNRDLEQPPEEKWEILVGNTDLPTLEIKWSTIYICTAMKSIYNRIFSN